MAEPPLTTPARLPAAAGVDVRGPLRGLRRRIFVFSAAALAVVLALLVLAFRTLLDRQLELVAASQAGQIATTIRLGLHQVMREGNPESIARSLLDVAGNPDLVEVVVADPEGRIRFSSRPERVGRGLQETAFGTLDERRPWKSTVEAGSGREVLYRASRIRNERSCQQCHPPFRDTIGVIGIGIDMAPFGSMRKLARNYLAGAAVAVIALFLALNYAFLSRYVLRPLDRLLNRFRVVGGGGKLPAPPTGSRPVRDEIDLLHRRFEEMIEELRRAHEAELAKERELIALQQDQMHRQELEAVNLQLTERIAEVGQANERINRLALALEDKNQSLERVVKNISALNRVGVALASELDTDRLVQLLINVCVKGLRVEVGYIMLMDEARNHLVMRAWTGLPGDFDPTVPVALGESVSGRVARSGEPLLLRSFDAGNPVSAESRYGYRRRAVLCAPIRYKERTLGTIELANRKGDESFGEEDLEMLQSIANQAAVALANANLYQELQRSYLETIRALVQAVEEKDPYTRGHSERVTTFSVKIARALGLSNQQVQMIQYAGVLHDIGKIGIDRNILQKRARLTPEEFDVVKGHPMIGERIIRPIGFLTGVLAAVSQHHERYDGFGYPTGIKGAQMSIEARILAVADAYDAMITERPYRKPLPRRDAIQELQRCSGTQFDPLVVEHFIDILDNDPEIHRLEERISAVGT